MAFKTGLEGKPWYYGLGVGLGLGLLIFGLGYWQYLQPKKDEIAKLETDLQALQAKITEGRAAQAQLPKFREEVRQLELELDKLLRILPARRNTADLLRRIRSLAEQGDFNLRRFTPGQLSDREFFSEWPIGVSVEGTYHNLALFFDRISRFSRIINVEDLGITAVQKADGDHTIAATFNAKTFVYKEPEPVEEAEADAKGKKRSGSASRAASGVASKMSSTGGGSPE
ncbi:MAG TPA: type 4a pilus biogenesis protein PilO [Thermoanaerobaculia bacterium]|nr:type 4a pilus biogenesis protein PilO [Thermoanaerobaculia bacterium]